MNLTLLMTHWISMFLAFAGGIMLAIWIFQHLKKESLLIFIVVITVLGLAGSYLTLENELQLYSQILGNTAKTATMSEQQMMNMMMNMHAMMSETPQKTAEYDKNNDILPVSASGDSIDHETHHQ